MCSQPPLPPSHQLGSLPSLPNTISPPSIYLCPCPCERSAHKQFYSINVPTRLTGVQGVLNKLHLVKNASQPFTIIETMNSILYPGRFTLLLGPPGAGKSTLLNALAGRLHKSSTINTTGQITYNGKGFDQFRAVHTSAYVDQNDLHQPELTVRETFNFAARCQGTGHKAGGILCMAVLAVLALIWPVYRCVLVQA